MPISPAESAFLVDYHGAIEQTESCARFLIEFDIDHRCNIVDPQLVHASTELLRTTISNHLEAALSYWVGPQESNEGLLVNSSELGKMEMAVRHRRMLRWSGTYDGFNYQMFECSLLNEQLESIKLIGFTDPPDTELVEKRVDAKFLDHARKRIVMNCEEES